MVYGIPLEMNGWKVVCTFTGPGGSVNSNGAKITVNADPAKATPVPSPTAEPSASPEATEKPEHEHKFSAEWSHDETYHWHECDCGETADKAQHSFQWTENRAATKKEAGEETGVCSVCGYSTVRATEYKAESTGTGGVNLGTFRLIFFVVLAAIAAIVIILIVQAVRENRRSRHRRKRK